MWLRPLWDWCTELLLNPTLVAQFQWNAEKLFKFDGEIFERFIDEPWTANLWWDIQVSQLKCNSQLFQSILTMTVLQIG